MNKPSKQELIKFIKDNNVTSYPELASHFNVKTQNINRWLKFYSIKLSDFQEKINIPSKQELIQFIKSNNGSSYSQLASHFNVNTSRIARWLKLYSIKLLVYQSKKPAKADLVKLIKDNNITSYSELASHFNVTRPCINAWLSSYSIKLYDFQEKINKPSKDELIKFIKNNNGSSYSKLASHFNVNDGYIARWLKSYSIKLSDYQPQRPSKNELLDFIKRNNGSSYKQLINNYQISETTITKWLKSYSIKLSEFNTSKKQKPSKQELIAFIIKNKVTSYRQLSDHYHEPKSTIANWLTSYSIRLSDFKKNNKPSKRKLVQFIKDNKGSSYTQLSNHYNVTKSVISHWLTSYSIKLSDFQEKINKPSKDELIKFIKNNNGLSYNQVAEHYNVVKSTISNWLTSYSMKLSDLQNENIFYHKDNFLNLSDKPNKNHISIKDLEYEKVVLLIKGSNPVVYVEKEGKGKTTTPKALIEEYIRKE